MPNPVQQAGGNGTATPLSLTLSAVGAANALILMVYVWNQGAAPSTITPSGGGVTWVQDQHTTIGAGPSPSGMCDIWHGLNASGGATSVSVAVSGSFSWVAATVIEWSGLQLTGQPDGKNGNLNSGSGTADPGAFTTTNSSALVVACAGESGSTLSSGPTSSFIASTEQANFISGQSTRFECAYLDNASAGSHDTTWTWAGTPGWIATIAGFGETVFPAIGLPTSNVVPVLTVQQW